MPSAIKCVFDNISFTSIILNATWLCLCFELLLYACFWHFTQFKKKTIGDLLSKIFCSLLSSPFPLYFYWYFFIYETPFRHWNKCPKKPVAELMQYGLRMNMEWILRLMLMCYGKYNTNSIKWNVINDDCLSFAYLCSVYVSLNHFIFVSCRKQFSPRMFIFFFAKSKTIWPPTTIINYFYCCRLLITLINIIERSATNTFEFIYFVPISFKFIK